MNLSVQSWSDFILAPPADVRSVVANAMLSATGAVFSRSATFLQTTWGTNAIAFNGNGNLASLDTTDASTVAEAAQWTLAHQMTNSSSTIAPAIKKIAFLKAGSAWSNILQINFGGATYTDIQLALRDNLGTAGNFVGSGTPGSPVLLFSGNHTGVETFALTLKSAGNYNMVLLVKDTSTGTYSTFEMEWVVLS